MQTAKVQIAKIAICQNNKIICRVGIWLFIWYSGNLVSEYSNQGQGLQAPRSSKQIQGAVRFEFETVG